MSDSQQIFVDEQGLEIAERPSIYCVGQLGKCCCFTHNRL